MALRNYNKTIKYKGKDVTVSNVKTSDDTFIEDIPTEDLFVSEPDELGKCYAFDIKEIEGYIKSQHNFINFYTSPKQSFSFYDLKELCLRSDTIKKELENAYHTNKPFLEHISEKTIEEMRLFKRDASRVFYPADLSPYYSIQEIEALQRSGANASDLGRGLAFQRFKTYYSSLSADEKSAINKLGADSFNNFGLTDLESIFQLPHEACLGGAAGVCTGIISQKELYDNQKKLINSVSSSKISTPTVEEYREKLQGVWDGIDKLCQGITTPAHVTKVYIILGGPLRSKEPITKEKFVATLNEALTYLKNKTKATTGLAKWLISDAINQKDAELHSKIFQLLSDSQVADNVKLVRPPPSLH